MKLILGDHSLSIDIEVRSDPAYADLSRPDITNCAAVISV